MRFLLPGALSASNFVLSTLLSALSAFLHSAFHFSYNGAFYLFAYCFPLLAFHFGSASYFSLPTLRYYYAADPPKYKNVKNVNKHTK